MRPIFHKQFKISSSSHLPKLHAKVQFYWSDKTINENGLRGKCWLKSEGVTRSAVLTSADRDYGLGFRPALVPPEE